MEHWKFEVCEIAAGCKNVSLVAFKWFFKGHSQAL